jgi:hypothetical protein
MGGTAYVHDYTSTHKNKSYHCTMSDIRGITTGNFISDIVVGTWKIASPAAITGITFSILTGGKKFKQYSRVRVLGIL